MAASEMHEPERQRALVVVRQQHHREQKLVPQDNEIERHRSEDCGHADRHCHAPENLEVGVPIHPRGVEQILRNLRKEPFQDIDGHCDVRRHVDQNEAG